MTRTFEGPASKFHLTDLAGRNVTVLDGIATARTATRLLGAAWPATMTLPADDYRVNTVYETDGWDEPFVAEGIRILWWLRRTGESGPPWQPAGAFLTLQCEDIVEDGLPVTHLSGWDARLYAAALPVVKADGSLPGPKGLSFRGMQAGVIAATLWKRAAALTDVLQLIDAGATYGGSAHWAGTIEETAEIDVTFAQGTMLDEAWAQLEQLGVCDISLGPIYDPRNRPGVMHDLSVFAEKGITRNGALFSWDLPPRSLYGVSRLEDGTKRANRYKVYPGQGGPDVPLQSDAGSAAKFGAWWAKPKFLTDQVDVAAAAAFAVEQLLIRKNRLTVVGINPAAQRAPQPIQDYVEGDRVKGYASRRLRKLLEGPVRVYGIPFSFGDDSRETIDSLIVSADAL